MLGKLILYLRRISFFLITAAFIAGPVGCVYVPPCPTPPPSQNLEIRTWYDLNATRNNLASNHTLMNDLNSTTPGYEEMASPTANGGKGWEPIGTFVPMCPYAGFAGTFDGQGHQIRDLYINRADENLVGLFGCVYQHGIIKDIGVTNITVIGNWGTGSLVGRNFGTISNSSAVGSVSGNFSVGALVGYNQGPVSDCYAAGNVVAGGIVSNVVGVMGGFGVGGLIGVTEEATVSNCYFTGNVTTYLSCTQEWKHLAGAGGLIGVSYGTVSKSHSNANVTGKEGVGGLVGRDLFFGTINNSYFTGSVAGDECVGGLVGYCDSGGSVSNSYSTGAVTGNKYVGGLVGWSEGGNVTNSYSTGGVTAGSSYSAGGLVGWNMGDNVSNSFWDTQTSGQATSDGGTGKNRTEMQDIITFSDAGWNITAVALNETNPSYIWNIVNNVTYPFLSWQL
jgi:hypothetical protein